MKSKTSRIREFAAAASVIPLVVVVFFCAWNYKPAEAGAEARDAFFAAVESDDEAAVAQALAAGVPADCREAGSRMTPLMHAARKGHENIARRLLAAGADINLTLPGTGSPLTCAARAGKSQLIRLLLQHGASPNRCDVTGFSPLMAASGYGSLECVDELIRAGADVNAADHTGNTPLIMGATQDNPDVLRILLAAGADLNARDVYGDDAEAVAETLDPSECARFLRGVKTGVKQ